MSRWRVSRRTPANPLLEQIPRGVSAHALVVFEPGTCGTPRARYLASMDALGGHTEDLVDVDFARFYEDLADAILSP